MAAIHTKFLGSIVSLGLLVAASLSLATGGGEPTTRPGVVRSPLRLATFNINYGITEQARLEDVVKTIRESAADVIAVQEANPVVFAHLRQQVAAAYPHIEFFPGEGPDGLGWLSKLPLKDQRTIARVHGRFDTRLARIEWAGRTLQLANVHLSPTIPDLTQGVREALQQISQAELTRRREIELIVSRLPRDVPVVLLGDFNTVGQLTVAAYLRERNFTDSFASVTPQPDRHPTWHWDSGGKSYRFRLDHIWHDGAMRTQSSRIVKSVASDHDLLVSEVDWAR